MGALTATAQPRYHTGFEPMVPGFAYVPYNDLDAVARGLDDQTAAVIILQSALDGERASGHAPGSRVDPLRRRPRQKDRA